MTDDLRDLLARAGRDEASAARSEDFHGAFGDAVRVRVKRRRAVRAAGVGSVAAVSVGAIAFGAVRLPGMPDAGPLGAADCPPGTVASAVGVGAGTASSEPAAVPTAHAIDVTSERDRETWLLYDDVAQEVALEVAEVREGVIEVTETGGQPYRLQPSETGLFAFEAPSGGWVTFTPGETPALVWSLAAPVTVEFDGSGYTVSSASGASAEVFVEDGELSMREPGGHSALRAQDGAYTIELSDGATVLAQVDPASGGVIAWMAEDNAESGVAVVTDAEPGFVCVTPEPSPTPSTAVDACADGSWRIDAEVLRPDLVYGVTNTEDPDSQESSVPGVAIQPMLLGQRVITVALDASTGVPLAMLEAAELEQELLVRLSEADALRVAQDSDGTFTFQLLDGRWMTVADADGPWNGQDVVGLSDSMPGAVSASAAPDDGASSTEFSRELAEDFDLEWPASPWVCNETRTGDHGGASGEATVESSPAPSSNGGEGWTAASTPYQCGFRFDADQQEHSDWAVTSVEWLEPEEAMQQLTDLYGDPSAVDAGPVADSVLRIEADGSMIAGEAAGELGSFDPGREGSQLQPWGEEFESTSIAVVQVVDGEVVGRTPVDSRGDEGWLVDRSTGGSAAFGLLLDMDALSTCDGADAAGADLYAVAAAATVDAYGTIAGPVYSWQKIDTP